MTPIHWPDLIRKLIDSGLTQPQLAEVSGCGQSTISDLLTGKTADPRTTTGLALIRLGNARCDLGLSLDFLDAEGAPPIPNTITENRDAA